jgi:hypothetical protein
MATIWRIILANKTKRTPAKAGDSAPLTTAELLDKLAQGTIAGDELHPLTRRSRFFRPG